MGFLWGDSLIPGRVVSGKIWDRQFNIRPSGY